MVALALLTTMSAIEPAAPAGIVQVRVVSLRTTTFAAGLPPISTVVVPAVALENPWPETVRVAPPSELALSVLIEATKRLSM